MDTDNAQLIADLYYAAVEPSKWQSLLDRLIGPLGARASALVTVDLSGQYNFKVSFGSSLYTPDIIRKYEQQYAAHEEEHYRRVAQSPPGTVQCDQDFPRVVSGELVRPDIDFLKRECGVYERFGVRLSHDQSWFDCLTFQYASHRPNVTSQEEQRLQPYLPHLAEVLVLSRCFSQLKSNFGAVLAVLDHVQNGIVLVSRTGHIILKNKTAAAILDSSDGLCLSQNGTMEIGETATNAVLRKAIKDASDTIEARMGTAHKLVTVKRSSGTDPYLLDVSPLMDANNEIDQRACCALITIIDPNHEPEIKLSGVSMVYGLSPAETAVAAGIIEGLTYPELAELRGVSMETIKSQVGSIYQKTNSNGRTALIRRALRVTLPIDPG